MAVLDGKNHKARFGLSVACIGNLNLDGRTQSRPKGIEVSTTMHPVNHDSPTCSFPMWWLPNPLRRCFYKCFI